MVSISKDDEKGSRPLVRMLDRVEFSLGTDSLLAMAEPTESMILFEKR